MTFSKFTDIFDSSGVYTIKDFKNKRIGIDASIKLIQAMKAMQYGKHLTGPDGRLTSHLKILFQNIAQFSKHNIDQIWIFDNSKRKLYKSAEHEKRNTIRQKNKNKIEDLELRLKLLNESKQESYVKGIDTPPSSDDEDSKHDQMNVNQKFVSNLRDKLIKELISAKTVSLGDFAQAVADFKYMLNMLGIKYIIAPDNIEAEQIGAALSGYNMIDYFLTTDPDYLLFSTGPMLQFRQSSNMNMSDKVSFKMLKKISKLQKYDLYDLDTLLKNKQLTPTQFIKVGICMGVDIISHENYTSSSGIKGIGPKSVIDIVKGKKKTAKYEMHPYHFDAIDRFKFVVQKESIVIYPEVPISKDTLSTNAINLENWLVNQKKFGREGVTNNIISILGFKYTV